MLKLSDKERKRRIEAIKKRLEEDKSGSKACAEAAEELNLSKSNLYQNFLPEAKKPIKDMSKKEIIESGRLKNALEQQLDGAESEENYSAKIVAKDDPPPREGVSGDVVTKYTSANKRTAAAMRVIGKAVLEAAEIISRDLKEG